WRARPRISCGSSPPGATPSPRASMCSRQSGRASRSMTGKPLNDGQAAQREARCQTVSEDSETSGLRSAQAVRLAAQNPRRGVLERDAVAGRVAARLDHLFRIEEHRRIQGPVDGTAVLGPSRSEEHTSELQSRSDLVCRLLLEKKKSSSLTRTQFLLSRQTRC